MNFSRNRVASEVSRTIGHDIISHTSIYDNLWWTLINSVRDAHLCQADVTTLYVVFISTILSFQNKRCLVTTTVFSCLFSFVELHLFIFNYIWLTLRNQLFIGTIKSVFYSHFDWALTTWDLLGMRLCHSFWCSKWWQLHNNSNCPAIQVS